MIEVEMNVELAAFTRGLLDLARVTGKPYGDIIRSNGRLIAVNLATQTQPFGDGEAAKQQGEAAVSRDINRCYTTPQKVYRDLERAKAQGKRTGEQMARAFISALHKGDIERARRIMQRSGTNAGRLDLGKFDAGAYHKRNRNGAGRVAPSRRPVVIVNPERIEPYKKRIIKRVGQAKGSFASAAQALGGSRGIPQFASRHKKKGHGTAIDKTSDRDNPHVIIRSMVPWIRKILSERQVREALRTQREKMKKHVETTTRKAARRAGFLAAAA